MLQMIEVAWGAMPPMASPGELVAVMAEAVGLPEATLISHDRALSEAGLRTKSGRGRSAARVTARDAANLLTAVLGSAQVRDTVHTVERYAASRPRRHDADGGGLAGLGIAELAALSGASSFIDAVEGLIAASANGVLDAAGGSEVVEAIETGERIPLIEVAAQTPGTVGEVRVAGLGTGGATSVIYALPDPFMADRSPPPSAKRAWAEQVEHRRIDTDMAQQRRVSAHTLLRLGRLLAGDGEAS